MINSLFDPSSFFVENVEFFIQKVIINHVGVKEKWHLQEFFSIGVHKVMEGSRDNIGQRDILVNDSTVSEASKSEALSFLQEA